MKNKIATRALAVAMAAAFVGNSQAYIHSVGKTMVDGGGKTILWKGFGLGEWLNIENYFWGNMPGADVGSPSKPTWGQTAIRTKITALMGQAAADQFYKTWTDNIITEADVAQYAGWGVNSIRVSLNYHWFSTADGVYLEDGFKMLDNLVNWGAKYGVYIILCMHAAPGGQGNELMSDVIDGNPRLWNEAATYQPWTIDLWKTIAARYANQEYIGGYDIFDEPLPPDNSNTKSLLPLYKQITTAIRSVDKNHMLIVEGIQWSQDFTGLEAPWDSNMAYSFHHYDFSDPSTNNDAGYAAWNTLSSKSNSPLWNGETGEPDYGSDTKNNAWATETDKYCTSKGYGWSWWTTKKVGQNTNPYVITAPANFSKIIAAFNGTALAQADAITIMNELAANAATAKCTKNTALITALGFCATCPPAKPLTTRTHDGPLHSGFALKTFTEARGLRASFTLPKAAAVKMVLCDLRGTVQKTLVDAYLQSGEHAVSIGNQNRNALVGGLYYSVLYADGLKISETPVLLAN